MPEPTDHGADPWKWYCRIDGATGERQTETERNEEALQHRDHECVTHDRPNPCWAEAGHLVHVWRY